MAYRWIVLLYTLDPADRPPLAGIVRIFFVSTFLGTFLPSVGGDAVRAYGIAKLNVRGGDAVASVFMDRMLGIASLFLMALVGLTLARDLAGNRVIVASLGLAAVACLMTLAPRLQPARGRSGVDDPDAAAWRRAACRGSDCWSRFSGMPPITRSSSKCSSARWPFRCSGSCRRTIWGVSLGIEASLSTYFAFLPLILLVMLLPVTVSGLGTGQAAFLWFFARVGVPAAAAVALSVLFIGLGVVGNLPGGILYALGPRDRSGAGL